MRSRHLDADIKRIPLLDVSQSLQFQFINPVELSGTQFFFGQPEKQKPVGNLPGLQLQYSLTRTVVDSIMKQIDALSGRIGSDTATLRTRLQTLRSLLNAPELSPSAEAATAITGTVTQIDEVLAVLPSLTEAKKGLQQAALEDTAALDEVDGRAYWNLKLLTQCGRARFNELGDDARAAPYHLLALHPSKAKPPVAPPP